MKRRVLSILLSLALCVGMLPATARAEVTASDFASLKEAAETANSAVSIPEGVYDGDGGTITLPAGAKLTVGSGVTVTLRNMTITSASGYQLNATKLTNSGTLTMENCTVSGRGQGLSNSGTAVLIGCSLSENNSSTNGSAAKNSGKLIMDGCLIDQNTSTNGHGGGVDNESAFYANNTIFSRNSSGGGCGGAIYANASFYLLNCTVANNTNANTGYGAGIHSNSAFYAANCVFVGNTTGHDLAYQNGLTLYHCLYGNSRQGPSGSDNTSNVTTSIFADNTQPPYCISAGGAAESGGCETYFDYSDTSSVKMGYSTDNGSTVTGLGGLAAPDTDKLVTTYYEGGTRNPAHIGASGLPYPIVTFNANGGSDVASLQMSESVTKASRPTDPTKEGCAFLGWYTSAELTEEYDFDSTVTASITLYAKWEELTRYAVTVSAASGGTVTASVAEIWAGETVTLTVKPDFCYALDTLTVTDASDNELTVTDNAFTMPASAVTVTATFAESAESDTLKFVDTLDELKSALTTEGVTGILVTADITVDAQLTVPDGVTIGGQKKNGVYPTIRVETPAVAEGDGVPSGKDSDASSGGVFKIASGSTVTLRDMEIMGGFNSNSGNGNSNKWGAIVNEGALTMENVAVTRSNPGLKNFGESATAVLKNCSFYRNLAEGNGAAGITCHGGALLVLDGCSFAKNSTYGGKQSAICMDGTKSNGTRGTVYANNCAFLNNAGSAIFWYGTVYLTNCTAAGNSSLVMTYSTGNKLYAANCHFAGNANLQEYYSKSGHNGTISFVAGNRSPGSTKVDFPDSTITLTEKPNTNGCGFYAPVALGGAAASGGVETYFDYSDTSNVKMGYSADNGSTVTALGDLTAPSTGKQVTAYYEGRTRYPEGAFNGVIGASGTPLPAQTVTAADVTCTYGDTNAKIVATSSGDGALSYAVASGGDVVSVAADGKLTTHKAGSATVTVTAAATENYRSGETTVNVTVNKADVSLSYATASVAKSIGDAAFTNPLSNSSGVSVSYSSNNTGVATVNASTGEVTVGGEGSATITAAFAGDDCYNEKSVSYTLTVSPVAVSGVTLSKSATSLVIGGTETLTATVAPSNATNKSVTWSSSDTTVATVSGGVVTAHKAGTATITVTTVDGGKTADCTVTVSNKAMVVSASNVSAVYDGAARGVSVSVTTPASGYTVKYGTAAGTYDLDASPTQTAAGALTVYYQVTAEDYDTVSGSATVTVAPKPITVTADAQTKTYGAANPALTYTASGLVGGDTLSGALSCAATASSNVGTYDITLGTLANANYTITFVGAALTVTKASQSAPTVSAVSAAGVATLSAAPGDAAVQYALLTAAGTPEDGDWRDAAVDGENKFTVSGTSANTTYYLYARYAADANHNVSPASAGVSFTTPAGFTVTFDPNGGSVTDASMLTDAAGKLASLPTPTREGSYSFSGWFTAASGGVQVTTDTVFTEDDTVYAHWTYTGSSSSATTTTIATANGASLRVSVSGRTAALGALNASQTEQLVASGEASGVVELDMSGLKSAVSTLAIPTDTVKAVEAAAEDEAQGAEALRVKLTDGGVTFDAAALKAIAAQATASELRLSVSSVGLPGLNAVQRSACAGLDVRAVYNLSLSSGGKAISDFRGGSADISIPHARKSGQSAAGFAVWYVASDGAKSSVPAVWRGAELSFSVGHFSQYAVVYDEALALRRGYASCAKDGACPISAFTDLRAAAWYHDGVHYCLENGLMDGVSAAAFLPDGTMTRADAAEMLWRLEGKPAASGAAAELPYSDAVRWAVSAGILTGSNAASLAPEQAVTREQLAVMLYRCAQAQGDGFTGAWMFLLDFPDASRVSPWASEAMHWVVKSGVVNGVGGGKRGLLTPAAQATRAEAATMLMRFAERRESVED